MILYHTSELEIPRPDIHRGRKNADFGWGFYLTPDRDFTYRWAREHAVVNEYAFDETGLEIRRFSRDAEWFDYIYGNRRLRDSLRADVVIGPIANDTIFDTLGILSSGLLKPEEALKLLLVGPAYTQVAVKTERAAARLKWLRAERIQRPDPETLRAERASYQRQLAAALAKQAQARSADKAP